MKTFLIVLMAIVITAFGPSRKLSDLQTPSGIPFFREGSGTPVVVFVSGMAHDHTTWQAIQDSIAQNTSTISYDRAGLGSSIYNGQPKDLTSLARELDKLISNTNSELPVIFVGHSMGCQVIRKYAALFPDNIAGAVFIDPGYDEELLKQKIPDSLWKAREAEIRKYQPPFTDGQRAEEVARSEINKAADSITKFPDVPVEFLTATMVTQFPASAHEQKVKKEMHLKWLSRMPKAKHTLVENSWHYIHIDAPDKVIHSIRTVLMEVK